MAQRVTIILNEHLNSCIEFPIKIRFIAQLSKKRKIDQLHVDLYPPLVVPAVVVPAPEIAAPEVTAPITVVVVGGVGVASEDSKQEVEGPAAVEEVFEVQASKELLALSSSYFKQILSDHKGSVLEMHEENPEKAALFVVFLHSVNHYPLDKVDVIEAKLAAKWLLGSVTDSIKTNIDLSLTKMCGDVFPRDVYEEETEDTGYSWNGYMVRLDYDQFTKIVDVVSTHTAYQGRNRFFFPLRCSYSTKTVTAIVNEIRHKQGYRTAPDLGFGLDAKDFKDFIDFSHMMKRKDADSDY